MRLWSRLVRFGFYLLYNPFAFTYDWVSYTVSMGAWREWVRSSLDYIDPDSLTLELAHGTGNLQLDMAQRGIAAVGYDLSPNMGRIARSKLRSYALPVRLARGKAQQLPFADNAFANIIATFPSEYIAAPDTLRECWRVLQPGGVMVVVPAASFTAGGAARSLLEALYRATGQQSGRTTAQSVVAAHMNEQAQRLFAPHGFEVTITHKPCRRSVAHIILAQKQG
jgi:ubiquinone/menaquinone biosynthesis C-methylase UbiE